MTGQAHPLADSLPVDTADLIAAAHGQPPPEYSGRLVVYGLTVVLLAGENTAPGQAVWLIDSPGYGTVPGRVSQSLCVAAEVFTHGAEGCAAPGGWRGGALAGLRGTLGPGCVHETAEHWPHRQDLPPVHRFWIDPDLAWYRLSTALQGTPRLARAFSAMMRRLGEPLEPESGWAMTPLACLSYYGSWHGSEAHTEQVTARLREMQRS